MQLADKIKELAIKNQKQAIETRRHLHMFPELSFHEFKTAEFVAGKLKESGIPFKDKVAGTGLVGIIEGKNPGSRTVALRADMDALPITETNDVPYKSKNT